MKIYFFKSLESTQIYLKELVKNNEIELPYAIVANMQTNGVGSRENSWTGVEGNLFLSFAIPLNDLPADLKLESSSIYFSHILQETLEELGSNVWLKWPNDFYIKELKIGGMITNILNDTIICGVGINLKSPPKGFARLDLDISKDLILKRYFANIEKKVLWKQVFSKYKLNFYRSQKFSTHINNVKVMLDQAVLNSDGSLSINSKRIYSLR